MKAKEIVPAMDEKEITETAGLEMDEAIEKLKRSLATLRAGAVSPNVLDRIKADYYGEPTPIKNLGSISVQSGTSLLVKVFDPTALKAIVAAIGTSDLGINPNVQGNVIRLNFPPLSGERRQEIAKTAKSYCDDNKVTIRNIRKDYIAKIKKSEEFSEDLEKRIDEQIEKLHDAHIKAIEELYKAKEKELLTL